ncbi:unnamed protein product [Lepeophtheirus salmonis]|uniref:(salmon louse) hypothetical protein n=1 Tax=Lepeophtheirus salmonis TaxID=72036 RepID=A0A7R8CRI1_LEPSM|nr:unnamed protein product [Lepeophtheirus salmonis]CAF2905642.1 unnamed protein product [Lepeophtheirus salmonis]
MEYSMRFRSPILLLILISCFLHPIPTKENHFQTWKLSSGKIIPGMIGLSEELGMSFYFSYSFSYSEERSVFEIISSTVTNDDGLWKKTCCDEGGGGLSEEEVLDCGKPVNFTYYDHLNGIHNRQHHPHIPEPDVALYFKTLFSSKKSSGGSDTQKTIECFRRALAVSPYNAAVLLNLARVFYNLQLLDDAIFLTRRSLEVQPPDTNAWLQHFQLGEILKAFRSYQEAALHFRHVLELKPGYGPALLALQDMESIPDSSVQINGISSSSNSYGSGSHRPSLKKLQIRNKNSHNSRG